MRKISMDGSGVCLTGWDAHTGSNVSCPTDNYNPAMYIDQLLRFCTAERNMNRDHHSDVQSQVSRSTTSTTVV